MPRKGCVHIIVPVSHKQRGKTGKSAYSGLAWGDLRGHSMCAVYDVNANEGQLGVLVALATEPLTSHQPP